MIERQVRRFEDSPRFKIGACIGALVLTGAGAAWALVPLFFRAGAPVWQFVLVIVPAVALGAVGVWRLGATAKLASLERSDQQRLESASQGRRLGIGFAIIFSAEGALIAIAAIALDRAHRPLLIPVVVLAIVGAHFIPLAKLFHVPTYRATGAVLVGLAGGSLLIADENVRVLSLGMASAFVFWASAATVLAVHTRFAPSDGPI